MSLPAGTYDVKFYQDDVVVEEATITLDETATPASAPLELRSTPTHLQWRAQGESAWVDLVALDDIVGDVTASGVEMRNNDGVLEWRNVGESTWQTLFDTSTIDTGGGGDQVTVNGEEYTTENHGISPSGDAATDRANLQGFIDTLEANQARGVIKAGNWKIDDTLFLFDGCHLRGDGMEQTIIDCPTADWSPTQYSGYYAMMLDVGNELHEKGVFLYDFQIIGADKNATDDGPLIRIEGVSDFEIKRVKTVDASSYGIYVTGYGVGSFTNDINSTFWNSTHRGVIADCVSIRGQVGMGLEGGAEDVVVERNYCFDYKLHGIRIASGYYCSVVHNKCDGNGNDNCNAVWIDRHKGIKVHHNNLINTYRGIVWGGFSSSDGIDSIGLIIDHNEIHAESTPMTDAYHGSDTKNSVNVQILGNIMVGGTNIRLLWSKRVNIQQNIGDGCVIYPSHGTTGIIGNNLMHLFSAPAGVVDIGNNVNPTTLPA